MKKISEVRKRLGSSHKDALELAERNPGVDCQADLTH